MRLRNVLREAGSRDDIVERVREFERQYGGEVRGERDERKTNYRDFVIEYYDLATDLYEFGWGQSFNFAGRRSGESFAAALARSERFLASRLELKPGMVVADFGCGIGGPMREIARVSGAKIVGINSSPYQIRRAEELSQVSGVAHLLEFLECDFMNVDAPDGSFDAVFSIQSIACAPDVARVYAEAFRVLKSGGCFAAYEYSLTDQFDAEDAGHQRIKADLEFGGGLPDIPRQREIDAALRQVGFELLEARDLTAEALYDIPWYQPLVGSRLSLTGFRRSALGRKLTNALLWLMEWARIVPRGTARCAALLNLSADAHANAGEIGIFTPEYFVFARKPSSSDGPTGSAGPQGQ
ncbi:MAG: methyltransferase domain-containing protein [Gammaproteobacteria bacterium]|nr:methyltransferase domain-containing protein [Gammaproteobacteria bacterium]MYK68031.1 methyltransferase domain-containing protein [Gammaproteobacteria bacterium]